MYFLANSNEKSQVLFNNDQIKLQSPVVVWKVEAIVQFNKGEMECKGY